MDGGVGDGVVAPEVEAFLSLPAPVDRVCHVEEATNVGSRAPLGPFFIEVRDETSHNLGFLGLRSKPSPRSRLGYPRSIPTIATS